jgi:hypothetical protein
LHLQPRRTTCDSQNTDRTRQMTKPLTALPVLGLAAALLLGLPTAPAKAQFATSAAPVGGATGSI